MKKFLSISLLFLYLVTTAGITISLHYCGGQLASMDLFNRSACCCEDESQPTKGCCKSEIRSIKITSDQLKTECSEHKLVYSPADPDVCKYPFSEIQKLNIYSSMAVVEIPDPPDIRHNVPVYKLIHSFLFYG